MLIDDKLYRRIKNGVVLVIYTVNELHEKLKIAHDQLGHFEDKTIWEWFKIRYWRPNMFQEIKAYVSSCQEYMFLY